MSKPQENPQAASSRREMWALLLGGILPLVVYTVVEEKYGVKWGLIAGMVFGLIEVIIEKYRYGKVQGITWAANGLILGLGGISLLTQEGIWFKLQPAILEYAMAGLLAGSYFWKKPFLLMMAEKQKTLEKVPAPIRPVFEQFLSGFTLRLSIFFLLNAILATYAAFHWSTRAWIFLKGIGFTSAMVAYGAVEVIAFRRRIRARILEKSGSAETRHN